MRILVTGSSGLIGSALVPQLEVARHEIVRLVRSAPRSGANEAQWDPAARRIDAKALQGVEAVVHLAGESIGQRWNAASKRRMRDSRVEGTRLLSDTLARLAPAPNVLVCASAVGYYGDRGDEVLRESSAPGSDFLARLCVDWEAAAEPARRAGIRVVHLRSGIVLSARGGALAKMLTPFRLGLGGVIGSGEQYMSWIALQDLLAAIQRALSDTKIDGPIHTVSPHPVTNREFTHALSRVLSRPTVFPLPAFAARLILGEMADALLLASQRAEPARLLAAGFTFGAPELEPALRSALS